MGVTALPVIAALGSFAVQQINQSRTSRKRDNIAAEGIRTQGKKQREANARINQQLDLLETSTPDDERATRSGQIKSQLRKQQALALAGIQPTGGGDAVTELAGDARGTAVGFGDLINDQLSGIDAPVLQRQGEAFERSDVQGILNRIRRESGQEDFLTGLDISGVRDSPLLTMLSQGLGAFASTKFPSTAGGSIAGAGNPNFLESSAALLPNQLSGGSSAFTPFTDPSKFGIFKLGKRPLPLKPSGRGF